MNYEIEADWHLLNTCNYRCAYCFLSAETLGEKLRVRAEPRAWQEAFDTTGKTWLLHLTGGEPSLYPGFVDLCQRLTERHFISLNSNLTHPAILDFAEKIDPARVSFINAGFHLAERENRKGVETFLSAADLLNRKGFPVFASLVSEPRTMERFQEAVELLRPIGLFPIPKIMRGYFEGRPYPQSYNADDKARFIVHAAEAREAYRPILEGRAEAPTINLFSDDDVLEGEPDFRGQSCDAGRRFVRINPNGEVQRCSDVLRLGNILDGTFVPLDAATPCDTWYCFYFCQKYVADGKPAVLPDPVANPGADAPFSSLWSKFGKALFGRSGKIGD